MDTTQLQRPNPSPPPAKRRKLEQASNHAGQVKTNTQSPQKNHGNTNLQPNKKSNQQSKLSPADEIKKHQQSLPIYTVRKEIVREIANNKSLIIIGETGSGKTTQIPQYVWQDLICTGALGDTGVKKGNRIPSAGIAITQPRRLAATSVASRVALELGVPLGGLVGYSVRFDDKTSKDTRIKFLTDGMLLRECMLDPKLENYKVVILDEAHERSINTDILCALLATIQKQHRPDLRIIIMSATLDADLFQRHFNSKVLYVQGRQFPVEILYTALPELNYIEATILAVVQIHMNEGDGDILAFLTGREEIEDVAKVLREKAKLLPPNAKKLIVCPLYAAQTDEQQKAVFEPTEPGCRKVVIATNIAETSLTVPNIRYVIDCGLVKVKQSAPRNGQVRRGPDANILGVVPISKEQAWQRAGRAGRTAPGKAYRLYTEKTFLELRNSQVPEIKRVDLSNLILQMLVIGVNDVVNFPYLEAPDLRAIKTALETLLTLGALDNSKRITALGREMALFPLEPRYSKILIKSKEFDCSNEILTIVAMLSVENIFYYEKRATSPDEDMVVGSRSTGVDAAKKVFGSEDGDHIFLLHVFNRYSEAKNKKQWCRDHFVNKRSIEKARDIREQLVDYWKTQWPLPEPKKQDEKVLSENIRKCLLSGFFLNTAVRLPNGQFESIQDRQEVSIHPSSVMFGKKPNYIIFSELVYTSKFYMRYVTPVEGAWLTEIAPMLFTQ